MRNPTTVLNSLTKHSDKLDYKYQRLYRILFNEQMYYIAYQNIYEKEGNMTAGVDEKTIDGMSIERIEQLVDSLRNESYQPVPSRRVYIPKKNGKKRPLGVPSFNDKLIQEVVRMILEAIYDGSFERTSHGFRKRKSCHTALESIQKSFNSTNWFIEGDIKGFFDNINHNRLIEILEERIDDNRFIRLIRKFLNAGYVEEWVFHKTHSGTPQGGIISPILANIYLDKLDKFIKEYAFSFEKGKKKRVNPEFHRLCNAKYRLTKKLATENDESKRAEILARIKELTKLRRNIQATDPMDTSIKRIKYVRYADDFLIGIIGSKHDSIQVKDAVKEFLSTSLKLELSDEKTLITNTKDKAKFLGYEIYLRNTDETRRDKTGNPVRSLGKKVVLKVPFDTMKKKLLEYKAVKMTVRNGKEFWKPKKREYLICNDDLEILSQYNAEIRGFYNYFSLANNSNSINSFYNIMEYSMYKTYAAKYKSTTRKVLRKFSINGQFSVTYQNRKGKVKTRTFYNGGFKRKKLASIFVEDAYPKIAAYTGGYGLMNRLSAQKCELCGATGKLEMHHIRKMKDLKGKQNWERRMISRQRKTLAVCVSCHNTIHAGKVDCINLRRAGYIERCKSGSGASAWKPTSETTQGAGHLAYNK